MTVNENYWLGRNFGFLKDRIRELRTETEQLRSALRDIFDELDDGLGADAPEHSHSIPGVWDDGEACEWCAKWNQIRSMIS